MRPADRLTSGYRVITDADVEVLVFIRQARSLGLSLDAIAEILEISADGAGRLCEGWRVGAASGASLRSPRPHSGLAGARVSGWRRRAGAESGVLGVGPREPEALEK